MGVRKPGKQEQPQNSVAKDGHQNGDQTHELKPVPRGHFLTASAHGLFGQEIQSTAIAVHSRSPVGRGFELTRCQFMAGAPLKTTGPTASFGAVVFSCTKAHSKQCAANMSKDLEADSRSEERRVGKECRDR